MEKIFKDLSSIIPNFPTTHVLYLGSEKDGFLVFLQELSQKNSFVFDVKSYEGDEFELFNILDARYNTKGYQYDTVFVNFQDAPQDQLEHLFSRVYASLKNAGALMLCLSSNHDFALQAESFLDELNFVAINSIELDESLKTIYAKKMHGWDGAR